MKRLTDRERLIYSSIEAHSFNDAKGYATQREIYEDVTSVMGPNEIQWNENARSHDHCFPIWSAVSRINQSPEVDRIVIIDGFRYYIATKEEAQSYIDNLRDSALRKLKRASDIRRKYRLDGQGSISQSGEDVEFREAFI